MSSKAEVAISEKRTKNEAKELLEIEIVSILKGDHTNLIATVNKEHADWAGKAVMGAKVGETQSEKLKERLADLKQGNELVRR